MLHEHAQRLGARWIATGHYARVTRNPAVGLLTARDAGKDQTYFLHAVDPAALARTLFPLGEWQKADVRARATAAGFANHAKRDSTGICFIGKRPFREFLRQYLSDVPGPVVGRDPLGGPGVRIVPIHPDQHDDVRGQGPGRDDPGEEGEEAGRQGAREHGQPPGTEPLILVPGPRGTVRRPQNTPTGATHPPAPGQHGGAAIQSGSFYAVHDADGARLVESTWVVQRTRG